MRARRGLHQENRCAWRQLRRMEVVDMRRHGGREGLREAAPKGEIKIIKKAHPELVNRQRTRYRKDDDPSNIAQIWNCKGRKLSGEEA